MDSKAEGDRIVFWVKPHLLLLGGAESERVVIEIKGFECQDPRGESGHVGNRPWGE